MKRTRSTLPFILALAASCSAPQPAPDAPSATTAHRIGPALIRAPATLNARQNRGTLTLTSPPNTPRRCPPGLRAEISLGDAPLPGPSEHSDGAGCVRHTLRAALPTPAGPIVRFWCQVGGAFELGLDTSPCRALRDALTLASDASPWDPASLPAPPHLTRTLDLGDGTPPLTERLNPTTGVWTAAPPPSPQPHARAGRPALLSGTLAHTDRGWLLTPHPSSKTTTAPVPVPTPLVQTLQRLLGDRDGPPSGVVLEATRYDDGSFDAHGWRCASIDRHGCSSGPSNARWFMHGTEPTLGLVIGQDHRARWSEPEAPEIQRADLHPSSPPAPRGPWTFHAAHGDAPWTVTISDAPCHDGMASTVWHMTATVTTHAQTYRGCTMDRLPSNDPGTP